MKLADKRVIEILRCPICEAEMREESGMLKCEQRHSFDLAREGYVNFLRKPGYGDSRPMLLARRAFFAHGHYQPLVQALGEMIEEKRKGTPAWSILDVGCGEGYYLAELRTRLTSEQPEQELRTVGLDFSKDAIKLAATRDPASFFCVADAKEAFPFRDASINLLLNIFAPRHPEEFARVLGEQGYYLAVIPGPEHLQELRHQLDLLEIETQKREKLLQQMQGAFGLCAERALHYRLRLSPADCELVVMMSPNYWHREEQKPFAILTETEVTIDLICLLFQRRD